MNKSRSKIDTSCPKSFKKKDSTVMDILISQTILNEDLANHEINDIDYTFEQEKIKKQSQIINNKN